VGDLLFVGSCNGMLHGVDRRTGEGRWTYNAALDGGKPEFHGRPLITGELIVVGSDDRRPEGVGHVYAFERSTLRLVWKYRAGAGVASDVVQLRETAYVVTLGDEVVALDLRTGAVQWKLASGASNDRCLPNSTPAIVGERLIFGSLDGTMYGLDAKSGAVLWRRVLPARVSTSVAIVGDNVFAGDADGRIYRLGVAHGTIEAQLRVNGSPSFKLVRAGESLLVFVHESGVMTLQSVPLALDAVRWMQGAPRPGWSSFAWPYVWKDWVIVGRETGEFVALRLADGQAAWQGKVTGTVSGIGGDETSLYLGTTRGTLIGYALPAMMR